jgi:hypothetical protein
MVVVLGVVDRFGSKMISLTELIFARYHSSLVTGLDIGRSGWSCDAKAWLKRVKGKK